MSTLSSLSNKASISIETCTCMEKHVGCTTSAEHQHEIPLELWNSMDVTSSCCHKGCVYDVQTTCLVDIKVSVGGDEMSR